MHTFVVTVAIGTEGSPDPPQELVPQTVHAWNLRDALELAYGIPFSRWFPPEDDDTSERCV